MPPVVSGREPRCIRLIQGSLSVEVHAETIIMRIRLLVRFHADEKLEINQYDNLTSTAMVKKSFRLISFSEMLF